MSLPDDVMDRKAPLFVVAVSLSLWACLLGAKASAISQVQFHWDEFWFLTLVHQGLAGKLSTSLQMFHVLLFSWLPGVGDEIDQLRAGRWVMWVALVVSTFLLYALARRWCSTRGALVVPVAFLACSPVVEDAASFRTDSLILPLLLASLLFASFPNKRWAVAAGACIGLAVAISLKAIFILPVAACLLPGPVRNAVRAGAAMGLALLLTLGLATLLEYGVLDFANQAPAAVAGQMGAIGQKTLLHWLPEGSLAVGMVNENRVVFVLMLMGVFVALRKAPRVAGLALTFLPILFYRNAFHYYYVVMVAPACVFVGLAVDALFVRNPDYDAQGWERRNAWMWIAIFGGFLVQLDYANARLDRRADQAGQILVVRGVHQIFPQPVAYLDHSGVMATFPKVNGFLSSWGLEDYRTKGQPFMPSLLKESKPPLLLADRKQLTQISKWKPYLLRVDQDIIQANYIPYWGPVWVAGALVPGQGVIRLPFPGDYRLEGSWAIINGKPLAQGAVLRVQAQDIQRGLAVSTSSPNTARLVWAAARPPPSTEPPELMFKSR